MSVHKELVKKLEEVLEVVKPLPQGYQYKVRELCACIETVVSMYDDVQKGIIPEVLIKMREGTLSYGEVPQEEHKVVDTAPEESPAIESKKKLQLGDIKL
ncbi:hypothetical protein ENKO_428 [Klebsiella phage fENko-Kae01]|nr:hypothetical protein [Klebsiella phage fENko-Kae01]